jgi:hypothetical protein
MTKRWETFGETCRDSTYSPNTVRRKADRGEVRSRRDAYGRRIFPPGTGKRLAAKRAKQEEGRATAAAADQEEGRATAAAADQAAA